MSKNPLWLIVSAALVAMLLPSSSYAQSTDAALSGRVTSAEEGAMEGVLVGAKKGTITITKEKSPNCAANMLRMKTRLIRKCAPEVATGTGVARLGSFG